MVPLNVVLIRVNLKVRFKLVIQLYILKGLDEYNDLVYYKLLDQLMGKPKVSLDEPSNPLQPCWTDIFDSQNAFECGVELLNKWYDHMANKIQNLHQKETEKRVRFTGINTHFSQAYLRILKLTNFNKIGLNSEKKVQNYVFTQFGPFFHSIPTFPKPI